MVIKPVSQWASGPVNQSDLPRAIVTTDLLTHRFTGSPAGVSP